MAKDVVNYRDIRNYLSIDQFIEKISTAFSDSGYNFEIGEVKWFSIFKIQEKISADWFAADGRVILVGDACHTHSPGGGLGMQAGMNFFFFRWHCNGTSADNRTNACCYMTRLDKLGIMDSYNLAWKLKLMESGLADKSILNTYTQERREVAEQVSINIMFSMCLLWFLFNSSISSLSTCSSLRQVPRLFVSCQT